MSDRVFEFEKILVPYVGGRIFRDRDGIALLASMPHVQEAQCLVLMADMQARNSGASLTNAMESVMNHVIATMFLGSMRPNVRWIQIDSMGYFDEVLPEFGYDRNHVTSVTWRPLGNRTLQRFYKEFGELGEVMIQRISESAACEAKRAYCSMAA